MLPPNDHTVPNKAAEQKRLLDGIHTRFNTEFPFFAKHNLRIRTKGGEIQSLVLNDAQVYLHQRIEQQIQATGKARIIILKGRQQGCSTYVAGRFYWKTTRLAGKATFILSHQAETTDKLFQMVQRYHDNCPEPAKAKTDVENRRRLLFSGLNSEYYVGTAGNEEVGRGGTVQYLHASEAAFYPPNSGFSAGLLQSVPDMPGTEVIIESTANGMDSLFYVMCMDALAKKGEFELVFIPWFWQKEYVKTPPNDFVPEPDEVKLAQIFKLSWEQIYWRRIKIVELRSIKKFQQEYPCTIEEAFITSGESLIPSIKISEARKSQLIDKDAPLIMGVDPAPLGTSAIAFRRGREMMQSFQYTGRSPMELAGLVANFIDTHNPVKCFIDVGNGYGVVARLGELGYGKTVTGVHFAEGAIEEGLYLNKRAEMWCLMRDWFIAGNVSCPDDDELHKQFTCVPMEKKTSSGLIKLESKDKIKEDTGIDPHRGDAYALTFAYPVSREAQSGRHIRKVERTGQSPLKTTLRRTGQTRKTESVSDPKVSTWS